MSAQGRAREQAVTRSRAVGQAQASATADSTSEDELCAATDEEMTDARTQGRSPAEAVHASTPYNYNQPGRGLPADVIARILSSKDLAPADLARSWSDKAWQRLEEPAVAAVTRSVHIRLYELGETGEQLRKGRFFDDDELGYIYHEETEVVLARMPNLVDLRIDWQGSAFNGQSPDLVLPGVRSMTLSRWQPNAIEAAPNLIDLTIGVLKATCYRKFRRSKSIRRLVINDIDRRLDVSEIKECLETMTPGSLVSLSMPLSSTSAALLLSFLEENLPPWKAFRELRLCGDRSDLQWVWTRAERQALELLSEKHRFRVYLPGEEEA